MDITITPRTLAASWFVIEFQNDPDARVPVGAVTHAKQFLHCLSDLERRLRNAESEDADRIQFHFYEVGKAHFGEANLRIFFRCFYLTLFGKTDGGRLGVLISLIGVDRFFDSLRERLSYLDLEK